MARGIPVGGILALIAVMTLAPHPLAAAEPCWTPAQLAARPGEELVRRGTPDAVRPAPPADADTGDATDAAAAPLAAGEIVRRVELPAGDRRIALTFDLCEQAREIAGYDGRIVDALRAADAKATFFAGGKWLLTHAERAGQLMADPLFEVAEHGWEHRNVRLLGERALRREIVAPLQAYVTLRRDLAARQCLDRTGEEHAVRRSSPRIELIRFPFGTCNPPALRAAGAAGLTAIGWDIASGDPDPGSGARSLVRRVLARVRPGSIVVFHANGRGWHTGEAMPLLIEALRKAGYRFATVSELIHAPGARLVTAPTCYDQRPGDLERYDRPAVAAASPTPDKARAAVAAGDFAILPPLAGPRRSEAKRASAAGPAAANRKPPGQRAAQARAKPPARPH